MEALAQYPQELSDDSESESEFEADPEDFAASSSSAEESDYDGSDASDDDGSSDSGGDSDGAPLLGWYKMSDVEIGDDWDELERKAAKCTLGAFCRLKHRLTFSVADKKRNEPNGKTREHYSDDSDRPKKKGPAKKNGAAPAKGKAAAKGKR